MKAPLYKGKSWLGAASEIQREPLELYTRIHRELGPVVRLRILPGMEMYSVAHPEAMEQILRKNQKNYPKPEIFLKAVRPLMGNGLFISQGHTWHAQRKLMGPSFHHRQIARMVDIMVEETELLAKKWSKDQGNYRNIGEDMMYLTLNIVSRTLFSTDVMSAAGSISEAVKEAFEYAGYRLNTPFSLRELFTGERRHKFRQAKKILDRTIDHMIRDRLDRGEPGEDMLGLLLTARDEESGAGMDAIQLRDELLTLMIAGHETTAAALTWSWYLLARNGDKYDKLHTAARDFPKPGTHDNIRLTLPDYAKWVFEESMRLYPPAWGVPRESIADDQIMGFEIDKGKVMNCSFFTMFRDPELWPEPLSFEPERFAENDVAERPKYASIPFGLGKRQCIGMNMALVEGPLILSLLAKRFRLHLPEGDVPMEIDATFALKPKRALEMKIEGVMSNK